MKRRLTTSLGDSLKDIIRKRAYKISVTQILSLCALHFDVSIDDIKAPSRKMNAVKARRAAIYLIKLFTKLSLNDIGQQVGGRDHSTIINSIMAVKISLDLKDRYLFPHMDKLIDNALVLEASLPDATTELAVIPVVEERPPIQNKTVMFEKIETASAKEEARKDPLINEVVKERRLPQGFHFYYRPGMVGMYPDASTLNHKI